ncbi:MAG: DUF2189 domain-containing protein [Pseudomonadota bacterium]
MTSPAQPLRILPLTPRDVWAAASAGWRDFQSAPRFGLFFGGVYVICGMLIFAVLELWRIPWAVLPLAVGFPLLGPFVAVGLYEVSRRLARGDVLTWRRVLGVVLRQKDRQIPSISAVIVGVFLLWLFIADVIYALFLGLNAYERHGGLTDMLTSENGLAMLVVGGGVGAALAFLLFGITAVSLPLLLDREVDFVTAMITSIGVIRANPLAMLSWAMLIATTMLLAMLPVFLGLLVVLPVLGHASWHLYTRALAPPAETGA